MTESLRERYDVVVLGGGMAALSLTRLLALELPDARVLTLDKAEGPTRKVGESTVEVAAHFLHSRLGLKEALQRTQLPKWGIRYWFDGPDRDLGYAEASEDGPATSAFWRTYQLERETLEREILALNRASGATHLFGARVTAAEVAPEGAEGDAALHRVRFVREGEEREVRSAWLVDATGPAAFLARREGRLQREGRIPHGSCWAWFRGARSPDEYLDHLERRRRFCFGRRILSTNSFMYEGYWVWMIPLASGALSVGVVYDKSVVDDPPRTPEEFRAFLEGHRMLAETLGEAEMEGFQRMDRFSERPDRYLGANRTASMGMAAGFVDPLYSSGLDFIAVQSEYVVDLMKRERAGEAPDPERLRAYDRFLELYFETTTHYFAGLYKTFVSQELSVPRYRRDVHIYWNLTTWPFFSRQFLDIDFLRRHEPVAEASIERTRFFARLFSHAYEDLKARGQLHRHNRGLYTFNQLGARLIPFIRFERFFGNPVDLERAWGFQEEIDALTFLWLLDVVLDGDRSCLRRLLYDAARDCFGAIFDLEAELGFGAEAFWTRTFELLTASLQRCLSARGIEAPGLVVTRDNFSRLQGELHDHVTDRERLKEARRYFLEPPKLDDLEDLPVLREELEPPIDWGDLPHSAWDLGTFEPRTVYDLLGERWWTKPTTQLPEAALVLARSSF